MHAEFSSVEESHGSVAAQDSSNITFESIAASSSPESPQTPSEVSLQAPSQDNSAGRPPSDDTGSGEPQIASSESGDKPSQSYFSDPRLDLLVGLVEQGRKNDSRLFKWLKGQNLITYWPPDDSYRVDRQLLLKKAATFDQLTAILSAPVEANYPWFVTEFLQCCRDNGYEVEDTSPTLGLEINIFLDLLLRPTRQGRGLWTNESVRMQLRTMIEDWAGLSSWPQLRDLEIPPQPTLQFLVTCRAVWDAARQRTIEQEESKIIEIFARFEPKRHEESTDLAW